MKENCHHHAFDIEVDQRPVGAWRRSDANFPAGADLKPPDPGKTARRLGLPKLPAGRGAGDGAILPVQPDNNVDAVTSRLTSQGWWDCDETSPFADRLIS